MPVTATSDIIGVELLEEVATEHPVRNPVPVSELVRRAADDMWADHLTKDELLIVRKYIAQSMCPSWHRAPPTNIGDPGAGKLKADQWRSCIEFDLVVAVARLYSPQTCSLPKDSPQAKRRAELFKSTMDLALALRWGTSLRTSTQHATKYMTYMYSHLKRVRDLYPNIDLLPTEHTALHFGELFLRFGPVQGWWTFPFERLIGRLQHINTNYKIGTCPQLYNILVFTRTR